MTENFDEEIKNLILNEQTTEEMQQVLAHEMVEKQMKEQWDEASTYANSEVGKRIFEKASKQIWTRYSTIQLFIRRYAVAASVVTLMVCVGLLAYTVNYKPKYEKWFVANSGRQSMDSIRLADGTVVILSSGSYLTYPEEFSGENRVVSLSGQAFFDVHPDEAHPFIVKTQKMEITALGTAFEVFSFDADKSVETTLLNGKIKVATKEGNYFLSPNEKLSLADNGKLEVVTVDADNYCKWRIGGKPSFKNEKLSMIIPRLEKWYGQEIKCPAEIANYYRFTFTVHNESLELMLDIISQNIPISYKANNNGYELSLRKNAHRINMMYASQNNV